MLASGALLQQEPVARPAIVRFHDALVAAGDRPEVHVYGAGRHGFGMKHPGTTSDPWIDGFYYRLQAQGPTRRRAR